MVDFLLSSISSRTQVLFFTTSEVSPSCQQGFEIGLHLFSIIASLPHTQCMATSCRSAVIGLLGTHNSLPRHRWCRWNIFNQAWFLASQGQVSNLSLDSFHSPPFFLRVRIHPPLLCLCVGTERNCHYGSNPIRCCPLPFLKSTFRYSRNTTDWLSLVALRFDTIDYLKKLISKVKILWDGGTLPIIGIDPVFLCRVCVFVCRDSSVKTASYTGGQRHQENDQTWESQ
jgi:hypothetical protein